jgi:hypothetical protein
MEYMQSIEKKLLTGYTETGEVGHFPRMTFWTLPMTAPSAWP